MTNEEFIKFLNRYCGRGEQDVYEHAKKLVALYNQVDALLITAKRIRGKAIDDGDYWEISDDVFQEVQKAFDEIKAKE